MLKKVKNTLETTTNSRVYKRYQRAQIIGCPICGPHSGCNAVNKFKPKKNWKKYRKTQYKL